MLSPPVNSSLDDSVISFIGKSLFVRPVYGYGWGECNDDGTDLGMAPVPEAFTFVMDGFSIGMVNGAGESARSIKLITCTTNTGSCSSRATWVAITSPTRSAITTSSSGESGQPFILPAMIQKWPTVGHYHDFRAIDLYLDLPTSQLTRNSCEATKQIS
jgi:hypothetical protein